MERKVFPFERDPFALTMTGYWCPVVEVSQFREYLHMREVKKANVKAHHIQRKNRKPLQIRA